MTNALGKLATIFGIPFYRRLSLGIAAAYLLLFLVALQDISRGGRGVRFLTAGWGRMFERTGAFTFEPIAQLTLPGLTILFSPLNVLFGTLIAALAGINLTLTYMAFRQPAACSFNRSTGILAGFPALLAGSACCAPAIVLVLGLQMSSLMIGVFQILIPVSFALLLVALKLILDRTDPALLPRDGADSRVNSDTPRPRPEATRPPAPGRSGSRS